MILKFEFESTEPLYLQLRNQIVVGIAEGKLKPGEKLPTIRALANESGINMMTVSKAYQMLKTEGYIVTDRRSGAVVAKRNTTDVTEATMKALRVCICELRVSGMSEEETIEMCRAMYREGNAE